MRVEGIAVSAGNKGTLTRRPFDATTVLVVPKSKRNGRKWTINFIRMSFGATRWSCKTVIYLQCELIDLQSRAVPFCSSRFAQPLLQMSIAFFLCRSICMYVCTRVFRSHSLSLSLFLFSLNIRI